jgi:inhibitor of cysteine peptidase
MKKIKKIKKISLLLTVMFGLFVFTCLVSFCFAEELKEAKVIETQVGKNFKIKLDANASTGYEWQLAKPLDENMLQLISSVYFPDNSKLPGAAGKQEFIFKALKVGKTTIYFEYLRPWEKNKPPEKEKSFVIVIR